MRISGLLHAVTALRVAPQGAADRLPGIGRFPRLSLAAVALAFVLTPIEPAWAMMNLGELMETDFFQDPNWRQEVFPCEFIGYYRLQWNLNHREWNSPEPPSYAPPSANPSSNSFDFDNGGAGGAPPLVDPSSDPPGFDNGDPGRTPAVPEPSTWAMLALGFAGLGYAALRRSRGPISVIA